MPRFTSQKIDLSKFAEEKRYCLVCKHHFSFHQLITRDKWNMFDPLQNPIHSGLIPWFCEFMVENPLTKEEHICGCTNLKPTTAEEVGIKA